MAQGRVRAWDASGISTCGWNWGWNNPTGDWDAGGLRSGRQRRAQDLKYELIEYLSTGGEADESLAMTSALLRLPFPSLPDGNSAVIQSPSPSRWERHQSGRGEERRGAAASGQCIRK